MVSSDKLPPSREELLETSKQHNVQISLRTKEEMMAGAGTVAAAWAEQCRDSGLIFLRDRYAKSPYIFEAELIKTGWRDWDIVLTIRETIASTHRSLPKPLFVGRERADHFISEVMLTKIIMVLG